VVGILETTDAESLKVAAEHISKSLGENSAVVFGCALSDGKVSLVASFGSEVVQKGLNAGKFIGTIARVCGGGGGGRPNFAQAGGKLPDKLPEAIQKANEELQSALSNDV
jgi:alanyl-tRNA synthetase